MGTPRSPQERAARSMQRRATYLECRALLGRLAQAIGERRPLPELDALRAEAAAWLREHPRNQ